MMVPNTRPYVEPVRRGTFPVVSYNYTLGGININRQFQPPLQDELVPVADLIPRDAPMPHPLPPANPQHPPLLVTEGNGGETTTDASTEMEDMSRRSSVSEQDQVCQNCSTTTTPLWRRDSEGTVLCNACGLFLKLHGRARPISLKTDIIKHRNRKKKNLARKKTDIGGSTSPTSSFAKIAPLPSVRQEYSAIPIRNSRSPSSSSSSSSSTSKDHRMKPRTLLDRDLQKEEFVIKLKTRVNELESLTKLYRGHIVQLEKRCQMLETKLDSIQYPK